MIYEDVPKPKASGKNLLVKNQSCGVNFIDTYHRSGLYKVQLPYALGRDGSGIVEEVGEEVVNYKVGDRVAYPACVGGTGSYAEYVLVNSEFAVKIPDGISFDDATAAMVTGLTAHYLLRSTYPVKSGDAILVHAAAGGLGQALVRAAKHIGAFVIGTVSSDEKAKIARDSGCDEVILYSKLDFAEETLKITKGKGVIVIYDSVGATTFDKGFACLARRGTMVLCGNASGKPVSLDLNLIAAGSKYVTRPSLGDHMQTTEEFQARANEVFEWIKGGILKTQIFARIPLKDVAQAHNLLEGRGTTGKLILVP